MKNFLSSFLVVAALLIIPMAAMAQFTVPQGGTGLNAIPSGSLLFGNTSLRVGTSSALQWNNALNRLTVTNASTTALSTDTLCLTTCITSFSSFLTGVDWGDITGTLSNQTDLQNALNAKQDTLTTGNLTENITGLEFNNTRQVIGGAAALSLTTGYTIPLTASTTEWSSAYASTTALTPAYIRGLFSGTSPISYNSGSGAFSLGTVDISSNTNLAVSSPISLTGDTVGFLYNTNNTWTGTNSIAASLFNLTGLSDGCLEITSNLLTSTGSNCGTGSGGITSLNGLTGSSQTFATSTSGGIDLTITSSGTAHTFTANPSSGYSIPLTASTTEWHNFHTTPSGRITAGDALTWSGNTLNFDGGNTPGGSLGGTWASPTIDDLFVLNTSDTMSGSLGIGTTLTVSGASTLATTTISELLVTNPFNADTATALAANGSNCSAGSYALGVNASGDAEGCTDATTEINSAISTHASDVDAHFTIAATGLQFSGSTLALTSGYNIPLTASTTNWNNFFDTPSTRITAGTGLSWSGNTLNASGGGSIDGSGAATRVAFWEDTDTLSSSGNFVWSNGLTASSTGYTAGSELVTNGTFTGSATGWTLYSSCSEYGTNNVVVLYDAGCQADADNPRLDSSSFNLTAGLTYTLSFDVVQNGDGPYCGISGAGNTPSACESEFSTGSHSINFVAGTGGAQTVYFESYNWTTDTGWTIDNVSIIEKTPKSVIQADSSNTLSHFLFDGKTNGSTVFSVNNSGGVNIGTSTMTSNLLSIWKNGGASEALTFTTAGRLGIGTTNPSTLLHVASSTAATSTIQIGTSGKPACMILRDSDDAGWTYGVALNGVVTWSTTSCE